MLRWFLDFMEKTKLVDVIIKTASDESPLPGMESNPGKVFLALALLQSDVEEFLDTTTNPNRWRRISELINKSHIATQWYAALDEAIDERFTREGELFEIDEEEFMGFQEETRYIDTTRVGHAPPGPEARYLSTWPVYSIKCR